MPKTAHKQPQTLFEILEIYKFPFIFGLISAFFIGISIVLLVKSVQTPEPLEIVKKSEISGKKASIIVDVEGAVVNPGVYELEEGSRVADALLAAGDLSDKADWEYMSKNINKAQIIDDGAKIYVPEEGEPETSVKKSTLPANQTDIRGQSSSRTDIININSASFSELDTLPGVGPVTANKIIDNRPYTSIEELREKKILKASVYEDCKNKLSL